jgi:uncharacterized protein (TIGR00297 family)
VTEQLLIGVLFAAIISVSSHLARFLTLSGSIAQFILGTILLGLGGWQWTVPMLVFFVLSSMVSKIGKRRRADADSLFEKSSRRDAWQVIANGGVAGAITLIWLFTRLEVLYVAYLGAVAAATADTWGTEIGTLSRSSPILVTTFKPVKSGRSGAISLLGTFAGVAGAFTIWLSSLPWLPFTQHCNILFASLFGGMIGSLADSFVGATLQAQYRCVVCRKLTERFIHCEQRTQIVSGFPWIGNDHVNLICTIIGAAIGLYLYGLLR